MNDDFDDPDSDVDEKGDDKGKEIKDKSLQTFPNLAAIFNELSSHSFMKVQHSLVEISTAFSHFETNHHPIPCTEPVPRVLHMGNEGRSASCTQQSSKGWKISSDIIFIVTYTKQEYWELWCQWSTTVTKYELWLQIQFDFGKRFRALNTGDDRRATAGQQGLCCQERVLQSKFFCGSWKFASLDDDDRHNEG